MTQPKQERKGAKVKILILILSVLLAVGCSNIPAFPVKQVKMLDVQHGVCGLYDLSIPSSGKPKYTWVKDIPLRECDGSVCMSPVDYKKAEAWALNIKNDYTCKLKE